MLDEWMEQKVDEACEVVPAYVNPRKIRLASSHIGWRLYLYGSSLKRAVSGFFVHIRSEQDMDIFLRETAEKSDTTILRIKRFLREKARLLAVLDDLFRLLSPAAAVFYLLGLASCCIFCYFFFILTTQIYIGYLFIAVFVWVFLRKLRSSLAASRYRCGNCGQKIGAKGVCPHCGAINE